MYESYFGFSEKPFSIAPDPRFVYLSPAHEEALAHLLYGLREGGGFVMLTGEVGTGKTTLLRTLLEKLPDNVDVAMIFNPALTPTELVATLCDELKLPKRRTKQTLKMLVDRLNAHLLETFAEGRRTVMIIDEAQALGADVLEQVRLLTNLETTREKLLEIILVGQPELRDTLARKDLRQLSQRITARYHLTPLDRHEVRSYVRHRLAVAGFSGDLFSKPALGELARLSDGIPRLVNEIGDRCLLGAYAEERRTVNLGLVRRAARQVLGDAPAQNPVLGWIVAPVLVLLLVVGLGWSWSAGVMPDWSELRAKVGLESPAPPKAPVVVKIEAPSVAKSRVAAESPTSIIGSTESTQSAPIPASVSESSPAPDVSLTSLPPSERFKAWVALHREGLTQSAALETLSGIWNLGGAEGLPDCEDGDSPVRCTEGNGGWQALSALDFPVALRLHDDQDQPAYAALTGLTRTDAILVSDGREWIFPRQALAPIWQGEYLVLWATPFAGENTRSGSNTAADWARTQLSNTFGQKLDGTGSDDPQLQDAVRLFQSLSGLDANGELNDATLLKLYAESEPEAAPRLWREG